MGGRGQGGRALALAVPIGTGPNAQETQSRGTGCGLGTGDQIPALPYGRVTWGASLSFFVCNMGTCHCLQVALLRSRVNALQAPGTWQVSKKCQEGNHSPRESCPERELKSGVREDSGQEGGLSGLQLSHVASGETEAQAGE